MTEAEIFDLPFPIPGTLESFNKDTYTTQQIAVQKIVYSLSGSIFSYSPESFNLDSAINKWTKFSQHNIHGSIPSFNSLETRSGAASVLLGYSKNKNSSGTESSPVPQSVLASTATLRSMNPVLAQYVSNPSASAPLSFNVAAVDYDEDAGSLVNDYSSALETARDLGLGLVVSHTTSETQDIALFSTALSSLLPSIHIYGGIRAIRESNKAGADWLSSKEISETYSILTSSFNLSNGTLNGSIGSLFEALNNKLGTSYKPFEYVGAALPGTVLVTFGSTESVLASQVVKKLVQSGQTVGVIAVRLYSPFLDSEFFKVLPASTKKIIVLGQVKDNHAVENSSVHSQLFRDVSTAVSMKFGFAIASPVVYDHKYSRSKVWSQQDFYNILNIPSGLLARADIKEIVFWDSDNSNIIDTPGRLAHTISLDGTSTVSHFSKYDNEALGGVIESQIRVSTSSISSPYPVEQADVIVVNKVDITKDFNVLRNAKQGAAVILSAKVNAEEISKVVSSDFKRAAVAKEASIYAIDFEAIGDQSETQGRTEAMVNQIAFWKAFSPELTINQITTKIVTANGVDTELVAATVATLVEKVTDTVFGAIEIPKQWTEELNSADQKVLPGSIELVSFIKNEDHPKEEEGESSSSAVVSHNSWVEAAKQITFPEAYKATSELRPDLPVQNFIAKVKENRRVTPEGYERHIFHFELDITGTGLKYAIGEALGVHARNDERQVRAFLHWYGISPLATVSSPSRDNADIIETRTALQVFRDNLDLFGKPPKKFYESLAPFATNNKEKEHLQKLASAAGAEELKRRVEVDYSSYADVLEEFQSAKPSLADLVQIISPLKRREYSIASSQHAHPNEVHLLIVVVDWVDSKGRKRYGQCSRYLSRLPVGTELVVSVKPSVMKLPPTPQQPIIMSGLGTGLAPFKALIEEKVWQKEQGLEIGEIYLYLGSRHQREEYLYGEIWEAYKDAGIITHIGAAFSRDQPQKIYIQDKIRESIDELVEAFVDKTGYFYLCGPTWPVPDITACLSDILEKDAAKKGIKIDTAKEIEELKETGRYVLEVY